MIEILYNVKTGEYQIEHDGRYWELEDLKAHVRDNGHQRESVSVGAHKDSHKEWFQIGTSCEKRSPNHKR